MAFAAVSSYALSGWITGIAAAFCFNFFAKKMGGVDAKHIVLSTDNPTKNTGSNTTISTSAEDIRSLSEIPPSD